MGLKIDKIVWSRQANTCPDRMSDWQRGESDMRLRGIFKNIGI